MVVGCKEDVFNIVFGCCGGLFWAWFGCSAAFWGYLFTLTYRRVVYQYWGLLFCVVVDGLGERGGKVCA